MCTYAETLAPWLFYRDSDAEDEAEVDGHGHEVPKAEDGLGFLHDGVRIRKVLLVGVDQWRVRGGEAGRNVEEIDAFQLGQLAC